MSKKTLLAFLLACAVLASCGAAAFAAQPAQSSPKLYGITLEGGSTQRAIVPGMMTGAEFQLVNDTAQAMIDQNNYNQAYAYLKPYEVSIFGTVNHWGNMARFDWLMAQIYERKNEPINAVKYLNFILDTTSKGSTLPTSNLEQYVKVGSETDAQYYYGAAINPYIPADIRAKAQDKKDAIYSNATRKSFGKPDPRMKYENYPRRRISAY